MDVILGRGWDQAVIRENGKYQFFGGKVVGMLEDRPEIIWKKTCHSGGINKMAYDDYFKRKDMAIAYVLGKVEKYENELKLSNFHIYVPPQSYVYID